MSGRRREAGAILVQFALFSFGILAIAALVTDAGMLILTQGQMQNATDGSALEGLRFRDNLSENPELTRRRMAQLHIARIFDDDLLATAEDRLGYGAGPVFEVKGVANAPEGITALSLPDQIGFDPSPALNLPNLRHGDLVAGTFVQGDAAHLESADYQRSDYLAASPEEGASSPSFLVRLRRTRDALGLDAQSEISTTGPTLPLLFGRGSLIRQAEGGGFDPRRDGLSVRATSIATTTLALRLSLATAGSAIEPRPLLPIAMRVETWDALPVDGDPTALELEAGLLRKDDEEWGIALRVEDAATYPFQVGRSLELRSADDVEALQVPDTLEEEALIPIYRTDGPTRVVIGFAVAQVTGLETVLQVVRRQAIIAANATAHAPAAVSFLAAQEVPTTFQEAVLAPVLAW